MKVNDELRVLELPLMGRVMNISLITHPTHGLTLVDAGLPGQTDLIEEAVRSEGLNPADIKHIVCTHQDLDHIGSLHELKQRTGARVYAFREEIPYIDGTLRPVKFPSEERLAQNAEFAAMIKAFQPAAVDEAVDDGQVLEFCGAVVIATPGHTPGHMSLYLPHSKTLITGDAMVSENGQLQGPMEAATPDMAAAMESVKKFLEFDVETIVCHHGGLVTEGANGQLKREAG